MFLDNPSLHEAPLYRHHLFHHQGPFPDGTCISNSTFGETRELHANREDFLELTIIYNQAKTDFNNTLTPDTKFPAGLTRLQAIKLLALQQAVLTYNGGLPGENTLTNREIVYNSSAPETKVTDFRGKKALACTEGALITQQLLCNDKEDVIFISGSAHLSDELGFEAHSYNIVNTQSNPVLLDIINPTTDNNGQLRIYCAPLTEQQVSDLLGGKAVEVNSHNTVRSYQYGIGGTTKGIW